MARISQYKALGKGLGGYKSTLSKVQSMEYAKKHSDWKAGEQKSLYSEIGGTVSNILGIVKEHTLAKKQKARQQKYDDKYLPLDKPERPHVPGPEPYQEELIGDIGVDPDAGADFDASAPIVGLESSFEEGMKGEVELKQPTISGPALPTGGGVPRAETEYQKKQPSAASRTNFDENIPITTSQRDMSAENAMVDQWAKEDADSPLFNEGALKRAEAENELEALFDERDKRDEASEAMKKDAELDATAKGMGISREKLVSRRAEDKPEGEQIDIKTGKAYYVDEFGQRSASRLDDTPVEGYRPGSGGRVPYKEPMNINKIIKEQESPNTFGSPINTKPESDNNVFNAVNSNPKSLMDSARDDNVNRAMGASKGNKESVRKVYAMESSSGTDPKAKGNPMQIVHPDARKDFESKYEKKGGYTLENSVEYYEDTVKKNVSMTDKGPGTSFENYKFKAPRLNKLYPGGANIYEGAAKAVGGGKATESHKGFVEYMTWQQGRSGALDIISTTMGEGGVLNKSSRAYMLNNVSDSQRVNLEKIINESPKKLKDKNLAKEWLKIQYKKWEDK